jgi:hypothetical protein
MICMYASSFHAQRRLVRAAAMKTAENRAPAFWQAQRNELTR